MTCNVITNVATSLQTALTQEYTPDLSNLESAVSDIWDSLMSNIDTGIDSDQVWDIARDCMSDYDISDHHSYIQDVVREVIIDEPELITDAVKTALPSLLGDAFNGISQEDHDRLEALNSKNYRVADLAKTVIYRSRRALQGVCSDVNDWLEGGSTEINLSNAKEVLARMRCVVDALENHHCGDFNEPDMFNRDQWTEELEGRLKWEAPAD